MIILRDQRIYRYKEPAATQDEPNLLTVKILVWRYQLCLINSSLGDTSLPNMCILQNTRWPLEEIIPPEISRLAFSIETIDPTYIGTIPQHVTRVDFVNYIPDNLAALVEAIPDHVTFLCIARYIPTGLDNILTRLPNHITTVSLHPDTVVRIRTLRILADRSPPLKLLIRS